MEGTDQQQPVSCKPKPQDKTLFIGAILAGISALMYALGSIASVSKEQLVTGLLFAHISISLAYVIIWAYHKFTKKNDKKQAWNKAMLFALLLFVNCFALNRLWGIFEASAPWLQVVLSLGWLALFGSVFFDKLPRWAKPAIGYILGFSVLIYAYFVLKLGILHFFGAIAILFLGLGAHVFAPALLLFFAIRFAIVKRKSVRLFAPAFYAGLATPILFSAYFFMQWNDIDSKVQRAYNHRLLENKTGLPAWVETSKILKRSWVAERYLKSGIIYPRHDFFGMEWGGGTRHNFDEVRQHDPLIAIAQEYFDSDAIDTYDKIQILASLYDKRHESQERLWTGVNLSTKSIVTNIRLYPAARLAYTEKTLTIANNAMASESSAQWNRNEAIYTFSLPEGSAVTSLSLWIAGKEQKAALTEKNTANQAYQAIVGVEARDPSLVHWQEGNTVSVRVFPCTPAENRIFKIGITSPLSLSGDRLDYQNITFVGPKVNAPEEAIKFEVVGPPLDLEFSGIDPEQEAPNVYMSDNKYTSDWSATMSATPLSDKWFTFENESYKIDTLKYACDTLDIKNIYLDVNQTWDDYEYKMIAENAGNAKLFVNYNGIWQVTKHSGISVFKKAKENAFSFFPFHEIKDPAHSVVITKGDYNAPHLSDLKGSEYADSLRRYFASPQPVHVVVLSGMIPPYIKMLKELRVIKTMDPGMALYNMSFSPLYFSYPAENKDRIVLENSQTSIERAIGPKPTGAPEHLLRMFAYNNVMRMIGNNYFTYSYITDSINREAVKGYVVSPVTSLVVLESAADYERFGIKTQNEHSLGNASAINEGATPEPFEWMLIAVCGIACIVFIVHKRRLNKA